MLNFSTQRLGKLLQIAELRADRALQELAEAMAERDRVRSKIADIDRRVSCALNDAQDPIAQHSALRYAEMKRGHRSDLIAELARVELQRKAALKAAQQEEGRRIALEKLCSHAS